MDDDLDEVVQALFDDGLQGQAEGDLLTIAGQRLIHQQERAAPSEALIQGRTYRSGDQRQLGEFQERGYQVGTNLLVRWLSGLRAVACDTGGERLNAEFGQSLFQTLSPASLRLLLQRAGHTLPPNVGPGTEIAVLVGAALLKRGLDKITRFDGPSVIEAESSIDFDVKIIGNSVLAFAPGGEIVEPLAFDADQISATALATGRRSDQALWRAYGEYLARVLLPGEIRSHFDRCLGEARANGRSICLRITVEHSALRHVPWELARYSSTGHFLAVSNEIIPVRRLHHTNRAQRPGGLPIRRIGLLAAMPSDLDPFDAEQEVATLRSFAASTGCTITAITPPTGPSLRQTLEQQTFQGFHFIGHGRLIDDTGFLMLEDERGAMAAYSVERLALLLEAQRELQFVFLNSCDSAGDGEGGGLSGVAPRLIQLGVPAVIAMQYPVLASTALRLSAEIYKFLARGFPLPYALQRGRQLLFADIGDTSHDFVTPVLFLNSSR